MEKLTKRDYQQAIDVQSACNLSGIIYSFNKTMEKISDISFYETKGTDWKNNHPICRLYAEQIAYLTGAGTPSNSDSYYKAYAEVEKIIATL